MQNIKDDMKKETEKTLVRLDFFNKIIKLDKQNNLDV